MTMKKALLLLCLAGVLLLALAAQKNTPAATGASSTSSQQQGTTYSISLHIDQADHSILGKPTLNAAFINRVLAAAHSPAAGTGQTFYQLSLQFGIDDVWPLAFFHHESDYGRTGEATVSLSIGNMRCLDSSYDDLHPVCWDNFAWFPNWTESIIAWYRMMLNGYIKGGIAGCPCSTVEQIIPVYAPHSDHNDEQGYISALLEDAVAYRAGEVLP